jgi:hypothetical protein
MMFLCRKNTSWQSPSTRKDERRIDRHSSRGLPPLDYETVEARAMKADYGNVEVLVASLSSIVGFKRLADRPRDRNDLIGLEEIHGRLPIEPLPGVDS